MRARLNVNLLYPIGSIYMSVTNINPTNLFGGVWESIAQGRTLVGVDTSQTEFNLVKKIGGSKYLQSHGHRFRTVKDYAPDSGGNLPKGNDSQGRNFGWSDFVPDNNNNGIEYTGQGNSGNLPPYFTCYIWCRIS